MQRYLASLRLSTSTTTTAARCVADNLVELLLILSESAAREVHSRETAPSFTTERANGSTSRSSSCTRQRLPSEWARFHSMFPEIPVVLAHELASDPPSISQESADTMRVHLFAEDGAAPSQSPQQPQGGEPLYTTTAQASVGVLELFTAALRALVALVADCGEGVTALLQTETEPDKSVAGAAGRSRTASSS